MIKSQLSVGASSIYMLPTKQLFSYVYEIMNNIIYDKFIK